MTATITVEQQVQELIELVNNQWKVNAIESSNSFYYRLEMEIGRKYIKVWETLEKLIGPGQPNVNNTSRSCWMFVDKKSGECYKPASYKAPAKGVRYLITQLANNPHICDPYGSFLYLN